MCEAGLCKVDGSSAGGTTNENSTRNTENTKKVFVLAMFSADCNVCIVGDARVGKSSLVTRAAMDKFSEVSKEPPIMAPRDVIAAGFL